MKELFEREGESARARATPPANSFAEEENPASTDSAEPAQPPANDNSTVQPAAEAGQRASEDGPARSAIAKSAKRSGEARKARKAAKYAANRAARAACEADPGFRELREIWRPCVWSGADDEAFDAYQAAAREVTVDVLLDAARAWVAGVSRPRFLPRLTTWFADRRWETVPPAWKAGERAGQRPPGRQGERRNTSVSQPPPPGSDAEAVVDRITDAWNTWARGRGAIVMRWLSDARAGRCLKLIKWLSQLHPDKTPDEAFRCLLGICDQSFFIKAKVAKPLEFGQLLDEEFLARMIEGAFRYTPRKDGSGWQSQMARRG